MKRGQPLGMLSPTASIVRIDPTLSIYEHPGNAILVPTSTFARRLPRNLRKRAATLQPTAQVS